MKRSWLAVAAAAVLLLAFLVLRGTPAPAPAPAAGPPQGPAPAAAGAGPAAAAPTPPAAAQDAAGPASPTSPETPGLVVRGVTVHDLDGRVAWRGDVDLAPTLARIDRGQRDPHRDDGVVFGNREGLLPRRRRGYYHEYVVRTPGLRSVGPQRLVLGRDGEVFYTSDHYAHFTAVRGAHDR